MQILQLSPEFERTVNLSPPTSIDSNSPLPAIRITSEMLISLFPPMEPEKNVKKMAIIATKINKYMKPLRIFRELALILGDRILKEWEGKRSSF